MLELRGTLSRVVGSGHKDNSKQSPQATVATITIRFETTPERLSVLSALLHQAVAISIDPLQAHLRDPQVDLGLMAPFALGER